MFVNCHCELSRCSQRDSEAIRQLAGQPPGLLRFARNDGAEEKQCLSCNYPQILLYLKTKKHRGDSMVSKTFVVNFPHGLHVRPAAALVSACRTYEADVSLKFGGNEYNLKSVLGVVAAGVKFGDSVEFLCSGPQADLAMEALAKVMEEVPDFPK